MYTSPGRTVTPSAAMSGSVARRQGCSTPSGAVASATSFMISPKNSTISDVVDDELQGEREAEIALRRDIGPEERDGCAGRQRAGGIRREMPEAGKSCVSSRVPPRGGRGDDGLRLLRAQL